MEQKVKHRRAMLYIFYYIRQGTCRNLTIFRQNIENVLIFGCRYHDKDYHYRVQWEDYASRGRLTVLAAFSRDQVC